MDWPIVLLMLFGLLIVLMATGMPVVFSFLVINVLGLSIFFGVNNGLELLTMSMFSTLNSFILLPLPMFILMGELMYHTQIAPKLIQTMDKWIGRVPGRLSLLSVTSGVLFSTLTGTSIASVAMLGSTLVPEMEKQGYKKSMTLGPLMGSGGLAMLIPPSSLAVLCGAVGQISIGKILVAIIIPGLLLAAIYAAYIIIRCRLQPEIAPPYDTATQITLLQKLIDTVRYVVPVAIVVFFVVGLIFLGVATPSEAAATGVVGTFLLIIIYRRLNWQAVKKATIGTLMITGMIFLILASAVVFSQILAYSGASQSLSEFAANLTVAPVIVIIAMMVILIILGCFMEVTSIMMITLPIFVPVVISLGFDPVWFAVIYLINIDMAGISPPFGLTLFVMKSVAPKDTTMGDVYRASIPFCGMYLLAIAIIIAFPVLALWLPELML